MSSAGDRGRMGGATSTTGTGPGTRQEGAGGVAGAARQFATETARRAEETWETTSRQARQMAEQAGDAFGDFRRTVGRYPFAVFFAGVGVGFLLAWALDRRTTDVAWRMSQASDR